eukprot:886012-Amorphochlora_amoeboformis.AAC.2
MAARLAIGTYEQLVYGAEAKLASSSDEKIRISVESLFRNEAHMGAVTCISSSGSGKYIASVRPKPCRMPLYRNIPCSLPPDLSMSNVLRLKHCISKSNAQIHPGVLRVCTHDSSPMHTPIYILTQSLKHICMHDIRLYALAISQLPRTCIAQPVQISPIVKRTPSYQGSSDETIRIFDIARLKDYGTLYGHEGSINCLEFYQDSHLISGSGDGSSTHTSSFSKSSHPSTLLGATFTTPALQLA